MAGLVRAGRLRDRVDILRRGPTVHDGYARKAGDFALLASRWCSVKPEKSGEGQYASGRAGERVMTFWLRYDEVTRDLSERDALDFEGRRYQIVSPPVVIGQREGIELRALAVAIEEAVS